MTVIVTFWQLVYKKDYQIIILMIIIIIMNITNIITITIFFYQWTAFSWHEPYTDSFPKDTSRLVQDKHYWFRARGWWQRQPAALRGWAETFPSPGRKYASGDLRN